MSNTENKKVEACTRAQYFITRNDLPLCCPMPDMNLWNAHPRVYLAIDKTGTATCPYCNAEYFLSELSKINT